MRPLFLRGREAVAAIAAAERRRRVVGGLLGEIDVYGSLVIGHWSLVLVVLQPSIVVIRGWNMITSRVERGMEERLRERVTVENFEDRPDSGTIIIIIIMHTYNKHWEYYLENASAANIPTG